MDNKDSITEINMYGNTVINLPPSEWDRTGFVSTALVDNAILIVKDWDGKPISTIHFKKNSKVTLVNDDHHSRLVWNSEDVISSTL